MRICFKNKAVLIFNCNHKGETWIRFEKQIGGYIFVDKFSTCCAIKLTKGNINTLLKWIKDV